MGARSRNVSSHAEKFAPTFLVNALRILVTIIVSCAEAFDFPAGEVVVSAARAVVRVLDFHAVSIEVLESSDDGRAGAEAHRGVVREQTLSKTHGVQAAVADFAESATRGDRFRRRPVLHASWRRLGRDEEGRGRKPGEGEARARRVDDHAATGEESIFYDA